jgi:hypothetical protein
MGAPHLPQRAPEPIFSAGTLLPVLQLAHLTMTVAASFICFSYQSSPIP